jgi:hypothetical protein
LHAAIARTQAKLNTSAIIVLKVFMVFSSLCTPPFPCAALFKGVTGDIIFIKIRLSSGFLNKIEKFLNNSRKFAYYGGYELNYAKTGGRRQPGGNVNFKT